MRSSLVALVLLGSLSGCSNTPPPRWVEGGERLEIPRARWQRIGQRVDLHEDGKIFVDGEHVLTIDIVGRVFEPRGEPVAVLQPEGLLIGKNERDLGRIGLTNAAPPDSETAWLSVGPDGEVMRFAKDGERLLDGEWTGCGHAIRACTLTSHLISLEEQKRKPRVWVGVGVGLHFGR